jgi:hypothetical protein
MAYGIYGDEIYLLTSDERNEVAWAELEVAPAFGGPRSPVAQYDRFSDVLALHEGYAYLGTRLRRITGFSGETFEDWEIHRVARDGTQDTLVSGNWYSFYLGEAGLLVQELAPSRLVLYPSAGGDPRPICSVRSLFGAAQSSARVVWWSYDSIWVCPLEGGEAIELDPAFVKEPDLVVVDNTYAYWATSSGATGIFRVALSAETPAEVFLPDVTPHDLAIDATHLYFAEGALLKRASLTDQVLVEEVASVEVGSLQLAGDYLYFRQYDNQFHCIKRVPK